MIGEDGRVGWFVAIAVWFGASDEKIIGFWLCGFGIIGDCW